MDRIRVVFSAKNLNDTSLEEARRRLEMAGWKHVNVELLEAVYPREEE
ncbi:MULTISPECIES: hypothetical protein [Bifidobacterium]|nr:MULTISPECIES: hypothetical protein [Bifidobacterium]